MKKIAIITDSKKDIFNLGDYLRIVSILPNFKTKEIYWFSDKYLHSIIKKSEHIKKIYSLNKFHYSKFSKKKDIILNLLKNNQLRFNEYSVAKLINYKQDIKISGVDLCKKICDKFKIKNYKVYSNRSKKNHLDKYDIFINYLVPRKWKVKEYPKKNLKFIEKKIKEKFKKIRICWQNNNDSLDEYIKKINSSKIILTIVGLGLHLGMLFNKEIIVLCGPTFFNDLKKYKKKEIIYPKKKVKWNKKGKMSDIQKEKILNFLTKKINKKIYLNRNI